MFKHCTFLHICPLISVSSSLYTHFFCCIFGFGYICGQAICYASLVVSSAFSNKFSLHIPKLLHHLHDMRRCLLLLNCVPSGLVFTFCITFSIHRSNKNMDNAQCCPSSTTISKVGDVLLLILIMLFVVKNPNIYQSNNSIHNLKTRQQDKLHVSSVRLSSIQKLFSS
jgi:hypothetical protein